MTDIIRITGIRGFGFHGVLDFERHDGQEFIVDVAYALPGVVSADRIDATINYAEVAQAVHDAIIGEPVDLIETLAERIAELVLALGAPRVTVTVHKPSAPIPVPFEDVSITIERSRGVDRSR
jgi:dihydroneopterin aldolase